VLYGISNGPSLNEPVRERGVPGGDEPTMTGDVIEPAALELGEAIRSDGLTLQFQPAVRLRDRRQLRLEALVRWDVAGVRLGPRVIVALAERNGLGNALSSWVLRRALARYRDWRELGVDVGICINVSGAQVADPGFPARVRMQLAAAGVAPSALTLDVSERAAGHELWRLAGALRCLADCGVRLALDDHSVEFGPLWQLASMSFTEVKLDGRIVSQMCTDDRTWRFARGTIAFARSRGVELTAEGVEDATTADILARLGCDAAQGRYLSASAAQGDASFLRSGEMDLAAVN